LNGGLQRDAAEELSAISADFLGVLPGSSRSRLRTSGLFQSLQIRDAIVQVLRQNSPDAEVLLQIA